MPHTVQVADFGISKAREVPSGPEVAQSDPPTTEQHTMGVGTPRYAAPETFDLQDGPSTHCRYDERADVYSFGLLLWEMSHNQVAFDGMLGMGAALHAREGFRPTISLTGASGIKGFAELIAACWQHDPAARMSMPACAEQLAAMLRRLEAAGSTSTVANAATGFSSSRLYTAALRLMRPSAVGGDTDNVSSPHTSMRSASAAVVGMVAAMSRLNREADGGYASNEGACAGGSVDDEPSGHGWRPENAFV